MKKYGKKWLAGAMAMVLAASLLTGCGNGDGESSTPAGTKETETTQEVETQGTTTASVESQTENEFDLASEVPGNTDPSPELIEYVNSTLDDSYLGDTYDALGSDYSAYDGRFEGVTLDVWYPDPNSISTVYPDLSEHPVFKQFTKLTGINVNFNIPLAGEGKTEFNLMVTGQELPDIIINAGSYYNGGLRAARDDGLILDLAEYEDKLPNYMYCLEHIGNENVKRDSVTDAGERLQLYTLTADAPTVNFGPLVKTKAMEDTGWTEVPETIEEWHSFLTDCKNAGYDVPLVFGSTTGFAMNAFSCFATAFGITESMFVKDDGTIGFGPAQEGLKDYLETMHQWYEEGLIDADFATGDSPHRQALISSDSSAAMIGAPDSVANLINGVYGEDLVAAPFPVLNKGDQPVVATYLSYLNTSSVASVTSQCENVDAALAFLDFFFTKKASELSNIGTYGDTHLINENGEPYYQEDSVALTDPEIKEYAGAYNYKYHLQGWVRALATGYVHTTDEEAEKNTLGLIEARGIWTDVSKIVGVPGLSMTSEESASIVDITNNISTARSEYLTKIITGQLPLSEVDTFQKTIQEMGLDTYLSVEQAAYDRYLAR